MIRKTRATKSSGNVLKDLEVPTPEEALAKAELTASIAEAITNKGLTPGSGGKDPGV